MHKVFIMVLLLWSHVLLAAEKRISLHFQDMPLRSALQQIGYLTQTNLVISERVAGNISLTLHKVTGREALRVILQASGLQKHWLHDILVVDTLSGKMLQENELLQQEDLVKKQAPLQSKLIKLRFAKATEVASLIQSKGNTLGSFTGALHIDPRTNSLWLQDTNENIREIEHWISVLDVPEKQVLIEARIVNISKNAARDLGVRFGVAKSDYLSGNLAAVNALKEEKPISAIPLSDRLNVDLAALPLGANPASIGMAIATLSKKTLLDLELSALESKGHAKVIARPELMTTNQQPALIESGEDIPYQESTLSGATAIAFKKAVLSLKVTPQVLANGSMVMDLQINQDSDSGRRIQGVPVILTKSINTRVFVSNGQTIVLGGCYQQDKNHRIIKVPLLSDLPIIGSVFQKKETLIKDEELLIFITPTVLEAKKQ